MLYVFLVNSGSMLTLDMQLALGSVDALKRHISEQCDLPADKQVLLISGGEWLDGSARVGSFPAGTDTSPIFLFSKVAAVGAECTLPCSRATLSTDVLSGDTADEDEDVEAQVSGALALPSSYSTVVSRSQLAQQLYERGKQQLGASDRLIREQHLQQQGWAAVVANMDDLTHTLRASLDRFRHVFEQYLAERPRYLQLIDSFHVDVQLLARVPLLEPLCGVGEGGQLPPGSSLLDWISAQDTRRLQDVCERTQQGLDTLHADFLREVHTETEHLLSASVSAELSVIGGLEERLMRLDELYHAATLLLAEQQELARAFVQNQNRATCVNDPSVLPDLCQSHCTQLKVMLAKHRRLVDTRFRCARAKHELSANICARLDWVITVQRRMTELCGRLVIYSERLKQLRQQAAVLAALHSSPQVFCRAAGEVVRRRAFSDCFLTWARQVAATASTAVTQERRLRRRFSEVVGVHFLSGVFPGLAAIPPEFATSCPGDFDAQLPQLTASDLRQLQHAVPELAELLAPGLEADSLDLPSPAQNSSSRLCCKQLVASHSHELLQLRELVKEQLDCFRQQMETVRAGVTTAVDQLTAGSLRRQREASEASTCAALAEARAEETACLLADTRRRCLELEARAASPPTLDCQATLEEHRERLHVEWRQEEALRTEQLRQEHQQQLSTACERLRVKQKAEVTALRARFRNLTTQLCSPAAGSSQLNQQPAAEAGQASVTSCVDGDVVVVVWDAFHGHYRVHQHRSNTLYFVHADSYSALGLSSEPAPTRGPPAVTAIVVSHEFCQAKKDGNRYRVPRGTKFYRVRLRPWSFPAVQPDSTETCLDLPPSSSPSVPE